MSQLKGWKEEIEANEEAKETLVHLKRFIWEMKRDRTKAHEELVWLGENVDRLTGLAERGPRLVEKVFTDNKASVRHFLDTLEDVYECRETRLMEKFYDAGLLTVGWHPRRKMILEKDPEKLHRVAMAEDVYIDIKSIWDGYHTVESKSIGGRIMHQLVKEHPEDYWKREDKLKVKYDIEEPREFKEHGYLICPKCRGVDFEDVGDWWICHECNLKYPVVEYETGGRWMVRLQTSWVKPYKKEENNQ